MANFYNFAENLDADNNLYGLAYCVNGLHIKEKRWIPFLQKSRLNPKGVIEKNGDLHDN